MLKRTVFEIASGTLRSSAPAGPSALVRRQAQAQTLRQPYLTLSFPFSSYLRPAGCTIPRRSYGSAVDPETRADGQKPAEPPRDPPAEAPTAEQGNGAPVEGGQEAASKKALEAKEAEAREWKDKALRQTAEFYNLQERTAREMKQAREFAIQSFAKDLLDSVDNLDRALATMPHSKLEAAVAAAGDAKPEHLQDLVNLHEGLRLTESGLMQALARHGLTRFDPLGEKFNPNEHEATFMTPQPDKEDGTVLFVQQKGFKLNGRIVRASKVGVVKNA